MPGLPEGFWEWSMRKQDNWIMEFLQAEWARRQKVELHVTIQENPRAEEAEDLLP